MPAQHDIFVSYRRADSEGFALHLVEVLRRRFGDRVFFDIRALHPGRPYPEAIDRALAGSRVVLVVIGPRWLTVTNAQGQRRLGAPGDELTKEIVRALESGVSVMPVLVEDAKMPEAADLPPEIADLASYHALDFNAEFADAATKRLVSAVAAEVGRGQPWWTRLPGSPRGRLMAGAAAAVIAVVAIALALWPDPDPAPESPVAIEPSVIAFEETVAGDSSELTVNLSARPASAAYTVDRLRVFDGDQEHAEFSRPALADDCRNQVIGAGGRSSCPITIVFTPTGEAGDRRGLLEIRYRSASDGAPGEPFETAVTGTALAATGSNGGNGGEPPQPSPRDLATTRVHGFCVGTGGAAEACSCAVGQVSSAHPDDADFTGFADRLEASEASAGGELAAALAGCTTEPPGEPDDPVTSTDPIDPDANP